MNAIDHAIALGRISSPLATEILDQLRDEVMEAHQPQARAKALALVIQDLFSLPGAGAKTLKSLFAEHQRSALNLRVVQDQLGLDPGQSYTRSRLCMADTAIDWLEKEKGIKPANLVVLSVTRIANASQDYRFVAQDQGSRIKYTFTSLQNTAKENPIYRGIFGSDYVIEKMQLGRRNLV